MKLWEGLSEELNYNVMYSPRGVMMLAHNHHDASLKRHIYANRLNGIDNEWRRRGGEGVLPAARHLAGAAASAGGGRGAVARRGTTRSPGAMRARPTSSGSTSSSAAR